MARRILDEKLMRKLADKLGKKDLKAINVAVSKRAAKLGTSPEAALVILAKENGIGVAHYQRKLDAVKQTEIRQALPAIFVTEGASRGASKASKSSKMRTKAAGTSSRQRLKGAIEYLIEDNELRDRCQDLLLAPKNFDRAINQATLVLEDRIRKKSEPPSKMVGETLVNYAFKEEIAKTVLEIASGDSEDQRGFTQMLRGVVPAFRNKTHHHIIRGFSREEAMRVCGFIDVLIRTVENTKKIR